MYLEKNIAYINKLDISKQLKFCGNIGNRSEIKINLRIKLFRAIKSGLFLKEWKKRAIFSQEDYGMIENLIFYAFINQSINQKQLLLTDWHDEMFFAM